MKIAYTVLAGNLYNDETGINVSASAQKYANLIETKVSSAFPEATVSIDWSTASGSTSLKVEGENEFEIAGEVDAIMDRIDYSEFTVLK